MHAPLPLVSVIMPVFNAAAYLGAAIESVAAQTHPSWELIIMDDCSTDHSRSIAQAAASRDSRIQVHALQKNSGGAARPRNEAMMYANGRYLAFLDSDDLWTPEKLEEQLRFMRKHDSAISCTSYRVMKPNGIEFGKLHVPRAVTLLDAFLRHPNIGLSTGMIDIDKTGPISFTESSVTEDFDLWARLLKEHPIHGLQKELMHYRRGHPSLSSSRLKMTFGLSANFYHLRREYGVSRMAQAYASYMTGYVKRRVLKIT